MPFVNGKFYINPAYGRAIENARAAEELSHREEDEHWVTIDHRHVLIRDTRRGTESKQPNRTIHLPLNEKERRLAVIVFNETGGLTPNATTGKGSVADLHDARVTVAEVSERVIDSGHANRVAPDEIQAGLWKGLNDKNSAAIDSWNDSLSAARAALASSETTNGATQFRLDSKNGTIPSWARGRQPSQTFGPFRNAGGGDARLRQQESTSTGSAFAMIRNALFALFFFAIAGSACAQRTAARSTLSPSQIRAAILAIQDEIYDLGYQKSFYMVGPQRVPGSTRLPLYIRPALKNGEGAAVYKLMPYGEVIRDFHVNKAGLVVLEGDPEGGFSPTQPNTLTVYVDDEEVCQWKRRWLKEHFEILDSPSAERVRDARERQRQRVGYSAQDVPPKSDRKSPP